jgi:hypothetical protein
MKELIQVKSKLMLGFLVLLLAFSMAEGALAQPEYAKWGKIAVKQTELRYPQADVVDYKHIGRDDVSGTVAAENFEFNLKQGDREWKVNVRVEFNKDTEQIQSISFEEVNR